MENKKILVIDDDISLCQSLKIGLEKEGAAVLLANSGLDGIRLMYEERPDLVLLDVRMPEMNGWETCKQIRMLSSVPIIMLTSLNSNDDVVKGLENGADDFVSKPFSRKVLIARIKALLRRNKEDSKPAEIYQDPYLQINLSSRRVAVLENPVSLSSTEYKLLAYLYTNAGQVMTYNDILVNVWGWDYNGGPESIHVYISQLRKKLEADPKKPLYLFNDHGVGYTFVKRR